MERNEDCIEAFHRVSWSNAYMVNCRNRRLVSLLLSKLLAYNWRYLGRFSPSRCSHLETKKILLE